MRPLHNTLEELEASVESRSSTQRIRVLRSVTDLFLEDPVSYSEDQVELFDDVLCRLVRHVEEQALVRLSRELAPVENAPVQLVRYLAGQEAILISAPVLKLSPRLRAEDLIDIASTRSQAHLLAIGSRPELEEAVTDVLVARGNTEVAITLARNAGARFSPGGFARLVTRAEREEGLGELVVIRSEMSPLHLRQLVCKATKIVRQRLLAVAPPEARARIERILFEIAAEIEQPALSKGRDYASAQRLVLGVKHDAGLMRLMLAEAAEQEKLEMTAVLLSALGAIPMSAVERILTNGNEGGLLLLCRAVDLLWPTVRVVLRLHPLGSGATEAQMDRWFRQFKKINPSTAQRVLGFWRVRGAVTDPRIFERDAEDWSGWTLQ
jgi:uncharacterized protein (DUF2336 family)